MASKHNQSLKKKSLQSLDYVWIRFLLFFWYGAILQYDFDAYIKQLIHIQFPLVGVLTASTEA
jgi:hypothetical protein